MFLTYLDILLSYYRLLDRNMWVNSISRLKLILVDRINWTHICTYILIKQNNLIQNYLNKK